MTTEFDSINKSARGSKFEIEAKPNGYINHVTSL